MLKMYWARYSYLFWHWIFQWNQDDEGDIVFTLFNSIHFVKYKEHTIVKFFGNKRFKPAPKYIGE